jgi:3-methylcrotonyl-CoA carboxylase alpha subunit
VILASSGGRHEVEVLGADPSGGLRVRVGPQVFTLRLERSGERTYRVTMGDAVETLHCVADGGTIHVFFRGRAYRLSRESATARPAVPATGTLEAPMPGRVVEVKVAAGDAVQKGQALLVIEAMKMENVVRAPRDGRVRTVAVTAGTKVAPGSPLLELE